MLIESILGYKSVWRVLDLMAETPGKDYTRQELKDLTQLGNEPLSEAVKRLVFAEILIKYTDKKRNARYGLITANIFTQKILEFIKAEREYWKMTPFDTLTLLNEFTRKAMEKTNFIKSLILFGSVARKTSTSHSDIDIAIITVDKDTKQEMIITAIIEELKNKFKRDIQTHYFTQDQFEKTKIGLINEIKNEGIQFFNHKKYHVMH